MEGKEFFGHYRISSDAFSRTGGATNYKATDTRTDEAVMLQLIPLASVDQTRRVQFEERVRIVQQLDHMNIARVLRMESDDEYLGLISEWVEGETAESWLVEHGPMSGDAVLRIGLQVVRALGAAAFLGLSHRAIEPANLMIVGGQTADGGWPFVKLLNFGLAGLAIYDEQVEAKELMPATKPQFASPEQLLDKPIDFRSEMYSLGATMCFLLTGAVPLAGGGMKARLRARRLPELRRAPGALRNLLVHMLRENPENRPRDPVLFEKEIQNCLAAVERRQELGRKLGLSLAAVIPAKLRSTVGSRAADERSTSSLPMATQIWRGVIAFAVLMILAAIVGAFILPEDAVPFLHRSAKKEIGVPVGVPSATIAPSVAPSPVALAANSPANPPPVAQQSQAPVAAQQPPPPLQPQPQQTPQQVAAASPVPSAAPQAPAEGPTETETDESSGASGSRAVAENDEPMQSRESPETASASASSRSKARATVSTTARRSTSSHRRIAQIRPNERRTDAPQSRSGHMRARVVGFAPDGRVLLRLPSGRVVSARPHSPGDEPPRRFRRQIDESEDGGPYQPFDPYGPRN